MSSNPTFAIIIHDRDSFRMRSLGLEPLFLSDLFALIRHGGEQIIIGKQITIPLFNLERLLFAYNVEPVVKTDTFFSEDVIIRMKLCENLVFVSPYPERVRHIRRQFGFTTMSTFELFERSSADWMSVALERSIEFAILWKLTREYNCSYLPFPDIITMSRNNQERSWLDQKIR